MAETIETDVAIIGAGPVGLFAVFELGMLKLTSVLVDALGEVGGQCTALYPEKPIYDIPAHPVIEASDLVAQLERQIAPFRAPRLLGRRVTGLAGVAGTFVLTTDAGDMVRAKAVVVAAGVGAFGPNRPPLDGLAAYEASGAVQYYVRRREALRGQRVVIAGGGDSAVEEGTYLSKFASTVYLVHRRDQLRASKIMQARALENPKITMKWNRTLEEVLGNDKAGVTGVRLQSTVDSQVETLPVSGVFLAIGHTPNTQFLDGQLQLDDNGYIVWTKPARTNTSIEGVFAAGDVADSYYRQAVTAAGTGCMAALDAERWLAEHGYL